MQIVEMVDSPDQEPTNSRLPKSAPLAGLALAAMLLALPAGDARAQAERPVREAPTAQAPAEPPSGAVQEKFRKLQKEMARTGSNQGALAAAGADGSSAETAPEQISMVSLVFQILLGLAFVLVLAVVSIRTLKRFQGRLFSRSGSSSGGDILEIMETCHLGSHQRVVAMRINDEVGVLGVTPQGISLLTVLKQPAEEIRSSRLGAGNSAAFSDNLNRLLDRFKKPKRVSDLLDEA